MEASHLQIRRALRAYHCHGCNREFREMVNLNDLQSVRCPNCQSDFFEEKKSFEQAASQEQGHQPEPQQQARPQMHSQPQAHEQNQQQQMPHAHPQFQMHQQMGMGGFPMQQSQTITRTMNRDGGWTQSVTISVGGDGRVHQTSQVFNGARPHQHQHEFAAAQEDRPQPEMRQPNQEFPREFFAQAQGAEMRDPFAMMQGLFGQNPFQAAQQSRDSSQRQGPENFLNHLFGGMGFPGGMPMGEQSRPGSAGCSDDFINKLPQKEAGKDSDCYICLEKCKDGKDSCELPCKHAFDRTCLTNWLKEHDSCPVCRIKLDQGRARPEPQPQAQPNFFFLGR